MLELSTFDLAPAEAMLSLHLQELHPATVQFLHPCLQCYTQGFDSRINVASNIEFLDHPRRIDSVLEIHGFLSTSAFF